MQKYDIADIQFNHNFWLNMVVLFIIFGDCAPIATAVLLRIQS